MKPNFKCERETETNICKLVFYHGDQRKILKLTYPGLKLKKKKSGTYFLFSK